MSSLHGFRISKLITTFPENLKVSKFGSSVKVYFLGRTVSGRRTEADMMNFDAIPKAICT